VGFCEKGNGSSSSVKCGNFLTSLATISFSRTSVLFRVRYCTAQNCVRVYMYTEVEENNGNITDTLLIWRWTTFAFNTAAVLLGMDSYKF
jgi:hypothetical protein